MNILDKILETKRGEVAALKAAVPFETVYAEARAVARPVISFSGALKASSSGIISEFKRRSPSKGFIKERADVSEVVSGYSANGAAAVSVLTDSGYFGGSLDDLKAARRVAAVPLLRKDFIIDPYQICEARIDGADVVLLIASALTVAECAELARFARSLKLEVLLEIHNEEELGHINDDVNVVGVNNRNLGNFVTDIEISKRLAAKVPDKFVKISESGISLPDTVLELRKVGFRGFLMGENFMKQADPADALARFIKDMKCG